MKITREDGTVIVLTELELETIRTGLPQKEQPKPSYKRERAKRGDRYYFIDKWGGITFMFDDRGAMCNWNFNSGNYSITREGIEFYIDKTLFNQKLKDRIAELNKGEAATLKNGCSLSLGAHTNEVDSDDFSEILETNIEYAFVSQNIGSQLIKEFGQEDLKKYYFGIK